MNNLQVPATENWRVNAQPLYCRVKETIMEMIRQGEFPNGRLPPENTLSDRISVSRATIREALAALSREGIISKRHGIGNLIHASTLNSRMRIDRYVDFVALLGDAGFEVRVERVAYTWLPMEDVRVFEEKEESLYIELCYFADERPAIRAMIYIPKRRLAYDPLGDESLYDTLPEFLNRYSTEPVSHSLCYFRPSVAFGETSQRLGMPVGSPILEWEESFYSIYDKVLAGTMICFNPTIVSFSLLRKWE